MYRVAIATSWFGEDDDGFRQIILRIWSTHLRQQDGDHIHANSACAGNADSPPCYGATVRPDSILHRFEGTVTETPNNLSAEIDQRVRARGVSFRRYSRELHDYPKASLLYLNVQMVEPEVVETLLYKCEIRTPIKGHYIWSVLHINR